MEQYKDLLTKILCGTQDKNILYYDLQKILIALGFDLYMSVLHVVYVKDGVDEIIRISTKTVRPSRWNKKETWYPPLVPPAESKAMPIKLDW